MNEYIDTLNRYVAENPPNYGRDAHTILEMLYCYYHECNNADSEAVKNTFDQPRFPLLHRGCRNL